MTAKYFRDPIPTYIHLQTWSKLRLAAALRGGDVLAASNEVRHLADLIRSQQLLVGEMVGLAIYRIDAHARAHAKAAGAVVEDGPRPTRNNSTDIEPPRSARSTLPIRESIRRRSRERWSERLWNH